jgi:predicted ATPase
VTSLEPLKLPLERVYRLGTLAVPPGGTPWPEALRFGALALLDERARAADRRFSLGPATVAAAIDICRQLDGIALALEMAAARLPWMGVVGVRDLLADRLQLLGGHRRSGLTRHSTLQAALAWSHGLLSASEKTVFRRLAVCRGGFTLEQASRIAADGSLIQRWEAIDALGGLVDKSLVQIDGGRDAAQPRFRLHESARLFARARLEEAGECAATSGRHAEVFAAFAAEAWESLWLQADAAWLATTEPEIDNLRAALALAVAQARTELVAPIFDVLCWLSTMLGGGIEARRWTASIEALAESALAPLAARLMLALGSTFRNSAPPRAAAWYLRGLGRVGPRDAPGLRYRLCCAMAITCGRSGDQMQAPVWLAEAEALIDPLWPARMHLLYADAAGFVALGSNDPRRAREHFRRFRALALECGADGGLVVAAHNIADLALTLGETDEAVRLGRELVLRLRRERNLYNLGFAAANLCAALVSSGDFAAALDAGREALPLLRAEEHAVWLFDHFALLAVRQRRHHDAARLQGYADAARQASASVRDPNEARAREQTLAALVAALVPADLARLLAEGALLGAPRADALALVDAVPESGPV